MDASPVTKKLSFFSRRKKQIKRWWSKFFVEEAYISDTIRITCDRYGEQVISTMLAGNAAPASADLQLVFQDEVNRDCARAWLSEVNSYNARRDHWISLRDFLLEITVIALILWEIRSGYRQEREQTQNFKAQQQQQTQNFNAQLGVLQNLQTSSKATADTLTALKTTTEIMNDALQKQLGLYYDVSLNVYFNPDSKKLELTNMGRTNISLWALGSQFLHEEPSIVTDGGRTVVTGAQFSIEASGTYTLIRARYPIGSVALVPFEIYLKNERQEEFVVHYPHPQEPKVKAEGGQDKCLNCGDVCFK